MNSVEEVDKFAAKFGISPDEIRKELEKIKEEYGVKDMKSAFAVLKSRIALKHLEESLERGR